MLLSLTNIGISLMFLLSQLYSRKKKKKKEKGGGRGKGWEQQQKCTCKLQFTKVCKYSTGLDYSQL